MVVLELRHGLGNQLFQYAFGLRVAQERKEELKIVTDWYDGNQHPEYDDRDFLLDKLGFNLKYASKKEKEYFRITKRGVIPSAKKIYRKVTRGHPSPGFFYEGEMNMGIKEKIKRINRFDGDVYLLGYWLDYKYVEPTVEKIQYTVNKKMKEKIKNKDINFKNAISIHIRRGDRLKIGEKNNKYATFSPYYKKALKKAKKIIKKPEVFVFSDDIEWCKRNIDESYIDYFVDENKERPHEDMLLMSRFRINIIPDSTFSLWAHWINPNKEKYLFVPSSMPLNQFIGRHMGFVKVI